MITLRAGVAADLPMLVAIDDDAAELFVAAGLDVELPPTHEFTQRERARWRECLHASTVTIAMDAAREPVGFVAVRMRAGEAFLQQISVRRSDMRRGVGSLLLEAAMQRARNLPTDALWLSTYSHLAWNRPFYERHGFLAVAEPEHPAWLVEELEFERRWLPQPDQRVAMRRYL